MAITCGNPLKASQTTHAIGTLVDVPGGTQTFFPPQGGEQLIPPLRPWKYSHIW